MSDIEQSNSQEDQADSSNSQPNGEPIAVGGEPIAVEHDDRLTEPVGTEEPPRLAFPVVGIGASAGGLEAFVEFFDAMPAGAGMAFVLVIHLPPERNSMVSDILSKHTAMDVVEVQDGVVVEPDHVYVIRPGKTLTIKDGRLRLGERLEKTGHNRPVDDFFRSLAEEQRERAICVVMSGMGSNGSVGAEVIKAVGGIAIAQDPESAKFPSMPRHLVESGNADFVRRAGEIPEVLLHYCGHPYVTGALKLSQSESDAKALYEILSVLKTRTRRDFNGYKKPTVLRRIQRRMGLNQITTLDEYARFLRQTPAEAPSLSDDLMIHVTGFFRDPEAWEALQKSVIKPLVREREDDSSIRCWVTACSSGEEAYTLAMLLWEEVEDAGKTFDMKVFATDLAERSLAKARTGVYPLGIECEVSPERLERFFDKDDSVYRVKRELREIVVFAPQNLVQDPPFSKLDICTCRNLLIYLEPELQRRVLQLLHFGLRDGGALFLGTSETIGGVEGMFELLDKRARIFRRTGHARHGAIEFRVPTAAIVAEGAAPTRVSARATVAQLTQRLLLDRHTPAAVTVDRDYRIVYFHGDTGPYLTQPSGEPTRDLMVMARESVRGAIRTALGHAASENRPALCRDGLVETEEGRFRIEVRAEPIESQISSGYLLLSFHQIKDSPPPRSESDPALHDAAELEAELQRTRDELQSTIEELQTTNEEMRASNEEAMSINEELQSTNEELETSKEELQSLNEELTTVNVQLQTKMEEHESAVNDLNSLLMSTNIAVIFLDTRFRIRRYTPMATDLFEMIGSDVGRPLFDLHTKSNDPSLIADCHAVLDRLAPVEQQITSASGRVYIRRVQPYRTVDNRIDGVVITFIDVTALNRAEVAQRASEDRFRQVIQGALDFAMLLMDRRGIIQTWNAGAERQLGWSADEAIGQHASMIFPGPDAESHQSQEMERAIRDGRAVDETWHRRRDQSRFWGSGVLTPLLNDEGVLTGFVKVLRDETARREAETSRDQLLVREQAARKAAENANYVKDQFLARLSHELRTPLSSILIWSEMLRNKNLTPEEKQEGLEVIERSAAAQQELLDDLLDTSRIASGKVRLSKTPVRLAKFIRTTIQALAPTARQRGVKLEFELPEDVGALRADRDRLRQVVQNLVANAIKFTPMGGWIKVSLARLDSWVEFKVEDSGQGIDPEFLPFIFTPFSQGDFTATRSYGGLGLGLAICRELVQLHGGTIDAHSAGKGQGATFVVRLPLSDEDQAADAEANGDEEAPASAPEVEVVRGVRILLVEDDLHTIEALTRMLESYGGIVTAVESADAAIDAFESQQPEFIISDIGLPEQDGFELMRRIRALEAERLMPPTPAIALSAFAGAKHRQEAREAGFHDYVPKPARAVKLLGMIARHLPERTDSAG